MIRPKHAERISMILDYLNAIEAFEDMDFPGLNLHPLKGKMRDHWAVKVSGSWRIRFKFEDGNVLQVDYTDYH